MKVARQTTSVPLYTGIAGMVRVSTNVPLPISIDLTLTSEYRVLGIPLISQLIKESSRSWRHRNMAELFSDNPVVSSVVIEIGVSANPKRSVNSVRLSLCVGDGPIKTDTEATTNMPTRL